MREWLANYWIVPVIALGSGFVIFCFTMAILTSSHSGSCTFQISNATVTLQNGHLLSFPSTQILCLNGTLDIEVR